MDTEPQNPPETQKRLGTIPGFSQPKTLPIDPLPPGSIITETQSPTPDLENPSRFLELENESMDDDPSPRTRISTSRKPGGDPRMVAQVLGGLLLLLTGTLAMLASRQGKSFRQPTPQQRDDIADPLARIAVRHLPLEALGPDLADATAAAVSVHSYVMDGPLIAKHNAARTAGEFSDLNQEQS